MFFFYDVCSSHLNKSLLTYLFTFAVIMLRLSSPFLLHICAHLHSVQLINKAVIMMTMMMMMKVLNGGIKQ